MKSQKKQREDAAFIRGAVKDKQITFPIQKGDQWKVSTELAITPDNLLARAIDKGITDLAQLEKLIEMVTRWEARKARQEYFAAFSKFQSIAPDLVKNKQVSFPHKQGDGKTEYKFQELGDIAKHIRGPLADCGLGYKWEQIESGNQITVTCIITHSSGHEERGQPLSGLADATGSKNTIQQKASTISYLRRYTLTGMLGLSSSDGDNDGAGGAKTEPGYDHFDEVKLRPLDPAQFDGVSKKVMNGEWTMAQVKERFTLIPDHEKALEKLANLYATTITVDNGDNGVRIPKSK